MQKNTEHIPNRDDVSAAILQHLDGLRGIDTHCHHLPDDQFQNMGVKFLYDHSYCNWMDTYPDDAQEVPEFLLQNSGNSYFYWLRCAISDLYNLPVNAANLNELDRTIAKAYEDPNHQLRILEEQCRYDRILLDNYTHPGQVESTGKLFVPVLRCNMFAVCNCKSRIDHNGNNPSMYIPDVYERNFDDYLERIRQYILQYRVLKFAIAYDEGNRVRNFDKSRAALRAHRAHRRLRRSTHPLPLHSSQEIVPAFGYHRYYSIHPHNRQSLQTRSPLPDNVL